MNTRNEHMNQADLAVAGTSQSTATPVVTPSPAFIYAGTSGGDGTAGIRLPKAAKGKMFTVKNAYNGNIRVYPASGDAINALGTDTQLVMAALTSATFIARDSTTWYTIPLLPS